MADASLGGETFRYTPMSTAQQASGRMEGQPEPIDTSRHQQQLNKSETDADGDVNVEVNPK
jgi:hypothetical protein